MTGTRSVVMGLMGTLFLDDATAGDLDKVRPPLEREAEPTP